MMYFSPNAMRSNTLLQGQYMKLVVLLYETRLKNIATYFNVLLDT